MVVLMVVEAMILLNVAASAEDKEGQSTQVQSDQANKIKAKVQKTGAGGKSKVRVKLRDGTDLRGYISDIGNDSFTVTDSATHKATPVRYADAQSVKGKGLSTAAKVLIVTGIGLAVVVIVVAIHGVHPLGGLKTF